MAKSGRGELRRDACALREPVSENELTHDQPTEGRHQDHARYVEKQRECEQQNGRQERMCRGGGGPRRHEERHDGQRDRRVVLDVAEEELDRAGEERQREGDASRVEGAVEAKQHDDEPGAVEAAHQFERRSGVESDARRRIQNEAVQKRAERLSLVERHRLPDTREDDGAVTEPVGPVTKEPEEGKCHGAADAGGNARLTPDDRGRHRESRHDGRENGRRAEIPEMMKAPPRAARKRGGDVSDDEEGASDDPGEGPPALGRVCRHFGSLAHFAGEGLSAWTFV